MDHKVSFFDQRTIEWDDYSNSVRMIDQTLLPRELSFIECKTALDMVDAIKTMKIRGAPAIGVAGAMGVALSVQNSHSGTREELIREIESDSSALRSARPTAVNLAWGVDSVLRFIISSLPNSLNNGSKEKVVAYVKKLADADVQTNKKLSDYGAKLFRNHDTILTHCNAGALATVGYGTALGVIRSVVNHGKQVKVFAAEARPVLQGARLTAFELTNDGFDVTLVADTAIGISMQRGLIDRVVVGADRITKTGHVFNKVGTYQIATLAKRHHVPFYVAAPLSTFDFATDWRKVKIEERSEDEVKRVRNEQTAPESVRAFNPAFDVTPPELISAIICEAGVLTKPYAPKIKRLKNVAMKTKIVGP
ncbi:MAG: S-methyl-5-thioribose-1-phosphate isomerase [Nitrososphaerota archaeon]|nr:S-methyl-5-thioribose-1-phosphate isomerase [Nitrososphaerota archaeon]